MGYLAKKGICPVDTSRSLHYNTIEVSKMATPNPLILEQLRQAQDQLAQLKAEKARLFPPNPHPFVEPDRFPGNYTADQIQQRNRLVSEIEKLEHRVQDLQDRLYSN
jgi:hypothetical protein